MRPEQQAPRSARGLPPHFLVDEDWLAEHTEEVLDPGLPIVDPHHHLWHRAAPYLVPQLVEDLRCGHDIRATVYVETGFAAREGGDPRFAGVGEVEHANGVAALFASGYYGRVRACAGIVGRVDLTLGAFAQEVLRACKGRAPERFKGVRHMAGWDASAQVSQLASPPPKDLLMDARFREGFACLAPLGLSFDAWCYHPQLPQLVDLVDAFPDTRVVVEHAGNRVAIGPYASRRDQVFREWSASIRALAARPNVFIKIGGLIGPLNGFRFLERDRPPESRELAQAWRPYVETCIDAFGPARAMFQSNFPVDKAGCSARVLWNAFKRLATGYSESQKAQLFAGTAVQAYGLPPEFVTTLRTDTAPCC